jgi:hypothetical protein
VRTASPFVSMPVTLGGLGTTPSAEGIDDIIPAGAVSFNVVIRKPRFKPCPSSLMPVILKCSLVAEVLRRISIRLRQSADMPGEEHVQNGGVISSLTNTCVQGLTMLKCREPGSCSRYGRNIYSTSHEDQRAHRGTVRIVAIAP